MPGQAAVLVDDLTCQDVAALSNHCAIEEMIAKSDL